MRSGASGARVLVVEHEADAGAGLLGERLDAAAVGWTVVGPAVGREIPTTCTGYDGVVVLGGTPGPTEDDVAAWLPRVRELIGDCLATGTPYLGVCLGAQLLAVVAGGAVTEARDGPELGLVPLRLADDAATDPLLAGLPRELEAVQWHYLEVARLPDGALTLCSSDRCQNQAFRVGPAAWGVQFHLEALGGTARAWAGEGDELRAAGLDPVTLVGDVEAAEDRLRQWWSQVGDRWIGEVVGAAALPTSG